MPATEGDAALPQRPATTTQRARGGTALLRSFAVAEMCTRRDVERVDLPPLVFASMGNRARASIGSLEVVAERVSEAMASFSVERSTQVPCITPAR